MQHYNFTQKLRLLYRFFSTKINMQKIHGAKYQ